LKDRIAVNYMERQYFGTQLLEDNNLMKFYPILGIAKEHDNLIDDKKIDLINVRRKLVNLEPIEDYIRIISNEAKLLVSMNIYIK